MKKLLTAALAVVMVLSLGTAAFAYEKDTSTEPTEAAQGIEQFRPEGDAPAMPEGEMPPEGMGQPMEKGMPEMNLNEMPAMPEGEMMPAEMGQLPEGEMPGEPGQNVQQGKSSGFNLRGVIEDLIQKLKTLLGNLQGEQQTDAQGNFEPGQKQNGNMVPGGQGQRPENNGSGTDLPDGGVPAGMHGQENGAVGGTAAGSANYSAAQTVTESVSGTGYNATADGENAIFVTGSDVTLTDITVSKTGSSSGDSADFYGVNAGVLAANGATLTISGAEVSTNGTHANGVFSYGSGTTVNISDSAITTAADNSGGIMTTGGGTMNATNLTVNTSGNSSAAIRSDRGGGTVNVNQGSYTASGVGSPAVYSTADITVTDATLRATNSEAVVIEGGNSVTIVDSAISGNNAKLNGQSTVKTNVLIYQSMSGDASDGNSSFTMSGGSMTAGTGAMFHVTNVTTTINLTDVDFTYAADSDVFLDASSDAWGTAGKNGGNVVLNLAHQDITGIITMDSASSVAVNLTEGSTWTLTGDSYVTSLTGDTAGIDLNGYTLYVNGVAWNG